MKYFIKRLLYFSSPVVIYLLIAIYIDPYNIVKEESRPRLLELKSQISYKLNYPLYKLQEFSDNPTDIILLGDSRTDKLNSKTFESLTKITVANLAYGGGTLGEIIETFWYGANIQNIKQVYIGINFNLYNSSNDMNRVKEAIRLKNAPFSYLFSQYCFKSTYYIIKSLITSETLNIEKPNFNKADFWEYQLESTANNFYRDYKYPTLYYKSLVQISEYCVKKNIKLIFFIPPTHIDLQHKVNEFELMKAESNFIVDLQNLGIVYDFDYPNKITENKDNFLDPFHCNDSIANIVINEIVTGDITYGRTNTLFK